MIRLCGSTSIRIEKRRRSPGCVKTSAPYLLGCRRCLRSALALARPRSEVDAADHVEGKDRERHLGARSFNSAGQEPSRHHSLHCAEWMFSRTSSLSHQFGSCIHASGHAIKCFLVYVARNRAISRGRAAGFKGAFPAIPRHVEDTLRVRPRSARKCPARRAGEAIQNGIIDKVGAYELVTGPSIVHRPLYRNAMSP